MGTCRGYSECKTAINGQSKLLYDPIKYKAFIAFESFDQRLSAIPGDLPKY